MWSKGPNMQLLPRRASWPVVHRAWLSGWAVALLALSPSQLGVLGPPLPHPGGSRAGADVEGPSGGRGRGRRHRETFGQGEGGRCRSGRVAAASRGEGPAAARVEGGRQ